MNILFFCPRWGSKDLSWDDFLQRVKSSGYDGIEASVPTDPYEKEILLNALSKHNLALIAQHFETVDPVYEKHAEEYAERLRNLASAKPLFINSQTGKDYFSFQQNEALIHLASLIAAETGVPVIHETHRGKFSFAAHSTRTFLEKIPELKITLDISHWCCVAETFLHDQAEAVEMAIERTEHIHSRIGFTEGAQITDPRAPEWDEAVQYHLGCWDKVIAIQQSLGKQYFTITSEFGAPPYMPLQPFTRQPLVDQWEVNVYIKDVLNNRYNVQQ
jgi:hypothetical protein